MANYSRKPVYHFTHKDDVGINKVPIGRMVVCEDYNGEIKTFIKKSNVDIDENTTVEQLILQDGKSTPIGGQYYNQTNQPTASLGAMWYNPNNNKLFTYVDNGTDEVWVDGAGFLTAAMDLKANISDLLTKDNTSVFAPSNPYEPATKAYVDAMASSGGGNVAVTQSFRHVATEAQTIFPADYILGSLTVYMNGIALDTTEYTAGDSENVILSAGALEDDIVTIIAYGGADVYNKTQMDAMLAGKASAAELDELRVPQPLFSGNTTSIEGTVITVTITNYDDGTYDYGTLETDLGSVERVGAVVTWTLPTVSEDTLGTISITASGNGKVPNTGSHSVNCTNFNPQSDQVAIYENATMTSTEYTSRTNIDISGDTLVHNAASVTLTVLGASTVDTALISEDSLTEGDVVAVDDTILVVGMVSHINDSDGANNNSTVDSIETHTSDIGTNGTASASTQGGDTSYEAWRAFDDSGADLAQNWLTVLSTLTGWLQYEFNVPKIINKYTLVGTNSDLIRSPKDWTIQASNTGAFAGEEDILDTVISETSWGTNEKRTFTYSNTTSYSYYRINMTANNGDDQYLGIGEMEFIESIEAYSFDIPTQAQAPTSIKTMPLGTAITAVLEQDVGEADWIQAQATVTSDIKMYSMATGGISDTNPFDDNSLKGKFEFDDNATDSLGLNNGTLVGGVTYDNGKFGKCISLDGTDGSRVEVPLHFWNYQYRTVSMWLNGSPKTNCSPLGNPSASASYLQAYTTTNKIDVYSSSNVNLGSSGVVLDNTWHHLVVTYGADGVRTYTDGIETSHSGTVDGTNDYAVNIGSLHTTQVMNSLMDQVEFYDRALSSSEVTELYNQTEGTITNTSMTITSPAIYEGQKILVNDGTGLTLNELEVTSSNLTVSVASYEPSEEFETVLYTGTGIARTITTPSIDTDLDFVWLKERSDLSVGNHRIFDSIRGPEKEIYTNMVIAQGDNSETLTAFGAGEFDIGNYGQVNENGGDFVAWCATLPNDLSLGNHNGATMQSEVKSNSFMSVISYAGSEGAGDTIGHGLSKAPEFIMFKATNQGTNPWIIYHKDIGNAYSVYLGDAYGDDVPVSHPEALNSTTPTDDLITLGDSSGTNGPYDFMSYAFTSVEGVSKIGSYTGTAGNTFVECGFHPGWIMIKRTDAVRHWLILDDKRSDINDYMLFADTAGNEFGSYTLSYTDNGFSIDNNSSDINENGGTYIFVAFSKNGSEGTSTYDLDLTELGLTDAPQVIAKDTATLSTSIVATGAQDDFEVRTGTHTVDTVGEAGPSKEFEELVFTADEASGKTVFTTNITGDIDFLWIKAINAPEEHYIFDSYRGNTESLSIKNEAFSTSTSRWNATTSLILGTGGFTLDSTNYESGELYFNGRNYAAFAANLPQVNTANTDGVNITSNVKANSFMSVVNYTGTGTANDSVGHGLGKAAELIVIYQKTGLFNQRLYHKILGTNTTDNFYFESTSGTASGDENGYVSSVDADTFILSHGGGAVNSNGDEFSAHCFTSVEGKCKVDSYTGASSGSKDVICGFEPQWLMVKRTNDVGAWCLHSASMGNSSLEANSTNYDLSSSLITFNADGFTINDQNPDRNQSGSTFLYMAIADGGDETFPTEITSVFDADLREGRDLKHKLELKQEGDKVTKVTIDLDLDGDA